MYFDNREPNYDKFPTLKMEGYVGESWKGMNAIVHELENRVSGDKTIIVFDYYHGVHKEVIEKMIHGLHADTVIFSEEAKLSEEILFEKLKHNITDDRVFGSISTHKLEDFFDGNKLAALKKRAEEAEGVVVVYGIGAFLVTTGDVLVYGDITRWEVQLRYRAGMDNWGAGNYDEDILRKYKRGYFVEWRVLDRHKTALLSKTDYVMDLNVDSCGAWSKEHSV